MSVENLVLSVIYIGDVFLAKTRATDRIVLAVATPGETPLDTILSVSRHPRWCNDTRPNDTGLNDTRRNDIRPNDIQPNDTQRNDIQQNDTA
jgi:hypothetical protein